MITKEAAHKMITDLVQCTCIDAYKLRKLASPDCAACNYNLDLFDIVNELLKERDEALAKIEEIKSVLICGQSNQEKGI